MWRSFESRIIKKKRMCISVCGFDLIPLVVEHGVIFESRIITKKRMCIYNTTTKKENTYSNHPT